MVRFSKKHVYDSNHGILPECPKNLQYLTRRIARHHSIACFIFIACLYFLSSLIHPNQALLAENSLVSILTRNVLVKFEEGTSYEERMRIYEATLKLELCSYADELNCNIVEEFNWFDELNLARVKVSQRIEREVGAEGLLHIDVEPLKDHVEVIIAEIDDIYIRGMDLDSRPNQEGIITDDPDLYDPNKSYAPEQILMTEGWRHTFGSRDLVIGILDTGINASHVEFSGRVVQGIDVVNGDKDPDDDHGHGTHAAGIIAAAADNGVGSAGVCPNCSIMAVKVLTENNVGTWGDVIEGIMYAVDNGARILNLSLGSTVPSDSVHEAVKYAYNNDVLIVAAAGNWSTSDPFYPAYFKETLAVSATDQTSELWSLSNFGSYVDVSAPGDRIYSTDNTLDGNGAGFTYRSGTSMAAAHVTGLAGLDDKFGAGRINVCKSMDAIHGPPLHDPDAILSQTYQVYLPVIEN